MTVEREPQPNHRPGLATILALSACAFCVLSGCAIARPSMKALLLQHYGKGSLPYAWLLVALGVTGTVSVYSRFAARMELRRLYRWAVVWTCITLCFALSLYHAGFEWAVFLLFVWKDIYRPIDRDVLDMRKLHLQVKDGQMALWRVLECRNARRDYG